MTDDKKKSDINETKHQIKVIQADVSYRRKAYLHLTGGLVRMKQMNNRDIKSFNMMDRSIDEAEANQTMDFDLLIHSKKKFEEQNNGYLKIADGIYREKNRRAVSAGRRQTEANTLNEIVGEMHFINYLPLQKELTKRYLIVGGVLPEQCRKGKAQQSICRENQRS